jgi:hypothetical protein
MIEYSVLPPGDSGRGKLPEGAWVAEDIVDRFGDDCGMEGLYDNYREAMAKPDVIAAFQAALDLMKSYQTYLCADDRVSSYPITITWSMGGAKYDWRFDRDRTAAAAQHINSATHQHGGMK